MSPRFHCAALDAREFSLSYHEQAFLLEVDHTLGDECGI